MSGQQPERTRVVRHLLLALAAALGVACTAAGAPESRRAPTGATAPTPPDAASSPEKAPAPAEPTSVVFGLIALSWHTQLPIAVAEQLGYFRAEGLVVEPQTVTAGGPVMMAMLVSGDLQMMITGIETPLAAMGGGAPAVIVGGHLSKVDFAIVGQKGLQRLDDLRGKVIAASGPGTYSEFALVEALRRLGWVAGRDFTTLRVASPARPAALASGQVDAVVLSAGDRVEADNRGWPALLDLAQVIPEFPFSVISAHRDFAAVRPEATAGTLRALGRAMDLIRQERDRAVELGTAHGLAGDLVTERRALEYYADLLQIALSKEHLAAYLAAREIPGTPEDYFDDRFLNATQRAR